MPGPVDNDPPKTTRSAEAAELQARTARAQRIILGFVRVVMEDSARISDYRTEYPGVETGSELHEGLINVGKRVFATHYLIENEEGEEGEGHTEQTAAIRAGFDRYWTGMQQALELMTEDTDAPSDESVLGSVFFVPSHTSGLPDSVWNAMAYSSTDDLELAGRDFARANARILVHTVDTYME